jgi:hypothetical protein
MVQLKQGDNIDAESFVVHKGVVCHHSSYFRGACESKFKEGVDNVFVLDNHPRDTFRSFVRWLYAQKVCTNVADKEGSLGLARLWILADVRGVPALKSEVINELVKRCNKETFGKEQFEMSIETINLVYNETSPESPLRRLLMFHYVADPTAYAKLFKADGEELPFEYLLDIARKHSAAIVPPSRKLMADQFHDHDKAEPTGTNSMVADRDQQSKIPSVFSTGIKLIMYSPDG